MCILTVFAPDFYAPLPYLYPHETGLTWVLPNQGREGPLG